MAFTCFSLDQKEASGLCAEHRDAHPSHISGLGERQRKGRRPHGPPVPKGAPTVELLPGWLENITELGRGQLLQHVDDAAAVASVWGLAVLLGKPPGGETTFTGDRYFIFRAGQSDTGVRLAAMC